MKANPVFHPLALLPLLVALAVAPPVQATTITFDDVLDGTLIEKTYFGVTFSNPIGGQIVAYEKPFARSERNMVSVYRPGRVQGPFRATDGAVQAEFAKPQRTVSIDAAIMRVSENLDPAKSRPFIEAYDSKGALIARTYFRGTLPDVGGMTPWETMTVTMPEATIKSVRFSHQALGDGTWGYFDNLMYATEIPSYADFSAANWKVSTAGSGVSSVPVAGGLEMTVDAQAAGGNIIGQYESICNLHGDFEVLATYSLPHFQASSGVRIGLIVPGVAHVERSSFSTHDSFAAGEAYYGAISGVPIRSPIATSDLTGTLRIVRNQSTVTTSVWSMALPGTRLPGWQTVQSANATMADAPFQLQVWTHDPYFADRFVTVRWDDVAVVRGQLVGKGC